ncbi:hypothetical protein J7E62_06520 [Variovorax paradoxus]|nr:hypothetical protein [Variovorax paradoxus]
MSKKAPGGTGDGSRPTTDGGVDNIGAGEKFSGTRTQAGEEATGPAPAERMADKRKNVEATRHDDSAPFGLNEDLTPETNKESGPAPNKKPRKAP